MSGPLSAAHRAAVAAAKTTWTTEQDARLAEHWAAGLSTAEIGRAMAISKNAVIGRAHRLRLPSRPSPIKSPRAASRPSLATQRPPVGRNVALTSRPAVRIRASLAGAIGRHTRPPDARQPGVSRPPRLPLGGGEPYRTCQFPLWPHDLPRPPRPAPFCGAPVAALGCSWCADHFAIIWSRGTAGERRAEDVLLEHAAP